MVWIIILSVVVFVGVKFFISLTKDDDDLQNQTLVQKFSVIVNAINKAAFNGRGKVTLLSKREFNLYKEDENQIVKFQYSTGILTVIWKYKYFQKEVVHEKVFSNVRNLSIFEQERIAASLVSEMATIIDSHKEEVIKPITDENNVIEQTIMDSDIFIIYQNSIESAINNHIDEYIEKANGIPPVLLKPMFIKELAGLSDFLKDSYEDNKNEFESENGINFIDFESYNSIIEDATKNVTLKYASRLARV